MSLKLVYQKLVDLPDDIDPIEVRLECDSNLVDMMIGIFGPTSKRDASSTFALAMRPLFNFQHTWWSSQDESIP